MKNLWKRLSTEEKRWLKEKYQDLMDSRDPYGPYDTWDDINLLEELFGQNNLKSKEEYSPEKIIFRGKRIDTNEWVYGDLLHIAGGCLIYFGSNNEVDEGEPARDDVCVELLNSECVPVYPESIEIYI